MTRKMYAGGAVMTTLSSGLTNVAATVAVVDGASYPDGSAGPFVIVVGPGTSNEEKMLVNARSGNSMTGVTRGYDGTSAVSHLNGEEVRHVFDALSADEANAHVNDDTADDHSQYLNVARHTAASHTLAMIDDITPGAWTPWTPTWANFTPGSAAITAKYAAVGSTVTFYLKVILSGSTMGIGPTFTLPVNLDPSSAADTFSVIGRCRYALAGVASYNGTARSDGTATTLFLGYDAVVDGKVVSSALVPTGPFTWGDGDALHVTGTYESA